MDSRSETFTKYKGFKLSRDSRSMDEICVSNDHTFMLQSHQLFLQKWMEDNFEQFQSILLYHRIGSGKCFQINTPILMFDGSIKMVQDVVVGDLVMGDDSTQRSVLSLGRGEDNMYNIIPKFGDPYVVNSEHILVLHNIVTDTPVLIEVRDFIILPGDLQNELMAVRTGVEFPKQDVHTHPYVFGRKNRSGDIPNEYKINSTDMRMSLLGGLCDGFGTYIDGEMVLDMCSDDVLYVARSLGLGAYMKDETKIAIFGKRMLDIPCIIHYKNIKADKENILDALLHEFTVEPKPFDKYYGFTLDGNHKFILGDFSVTHNTCTSITMALKYIQLQKGGKVTVILPARLRTNFFDELFSPCVTTNKEMSQFSNSNKNVIKKKIKESFDVMSIEAFRKTAMDTDLKKWANNFTKNKFIIVDEVHNLISKYDKNDFQSIVEKNRYTKKTNIKGMNTILFLFLLQNVHPTCKLVFLTATPIFDNNRQFRDLIQIMNPMTNLDPFMRLKDGIEMMRGRVSFFPGASPQSYPIVTYKEYNEKAGERQTELIKDAINHDDKNEEKNAFRMKERMACISAFSEKRIDKAITNMKEYCPKVRRIYFNVKKLPGKHIVYSNFVQVGVKLVAEAFKSKGWVDFKDPLAKSKHYKVFVVWDGSMKDKDKENVKNVLNSKTNISGKLIRLVIGSPSIREGVSFKHIQHMHLLDPVWNFATKMQIEGRAIRFCSHVDISPTDDVLRRAVVIHVYRTTIDEETKTVDEVIYDEMIPNKYKSVSIIENALKEVSFDHILYRDLHKLNGNPYPNWEHPSPIEIEDDIVINKTQKDAVINKTCPKKRRPQGGVCNEPNTIIKLNKHNDECCYKKMSIKKPTIVENKLTTSVEDKKKSQTKCPTIRRPINGKCQDKEMIIKPNKQGDPCCYKTKLQKA